MRRVFSGLSHRVVPSIVVAALVLTCITVLPGQLSYAQSTHTPWRTMTLAKLTAVWWQWSLGIPVSISPFFDDTGAHAYSGQPYSDLLFLAGTFSISETSTGDQVGEVTRSITVKRGTALFFPLLNTEADNVCVKPHLGGNCFEQEPFPNVLGVPELRAVAKAQVDPATDLHATLTPTDDAFTPTGDPVDVGYERLQSPPFGYTVPAVDNLYDFFGIHGVSGKVAPAVSDGYWSFVPGTLAPGHYKLEFGGSFPINQGANTFTEIITYHITVTR